MKKITTEYDKLAILDYDIVIIDDDIYDCQDAFFQGEPPNYIELPWLIGVGLAVLINNE